MLNISCLPIPNYSNNHVLQLGWFRDQANSIHRNDIAMLREDFSDAFIHSAFRALAGEFAVYEGYLKRDTPPNNLKIWYFDFKKVE